MAFRGYTYKVLPSPDQAAVMRNWIGVCRLVYNIALEQRKTWWKHHKRLTGKPINYVSQGREVTALRSEFDWVKAVPCNSLHRVLKELDQAFAAYFAKRSKHPNFRKRGDNDNFKLLSKDVQIKKLNAKWSAVKLPKMPWMKFRRTRELQGSIKSVTISVKASEWKISFHCEEDINPAEPKDGSVGIDRGIATTLALSTGELILLPKKLKKLHHQKRKAQRVASRRIRGSNRHAAAHARVAKIVIKQANIRRDFYHKATLNIAERFGVAVIEGLNVRGMSASAAGSVESPGRNVAQKSGLNREIMNSAWWQFESLLTYKMEARGGRVVRVKPEYTSQTCSACGVIDARSRKSQARFICISCGHSDHADINAAKEIVRRGSTPCLRAEEPGSGSVEARTVDMHMHGLNLALTDRGDADAGGVEACFSRNLD